MKINIAAIAFSAQALFGSAIAANCWGNKINFNEGQGGADGALWDLRSSVCNGNWRYGAGGMGSQNAWVHFTTTNNNYCWDALADIIDQCFRNGWSQGDWSMNGQTYFGQIHFPKNW